MNEEFKKIRDQLHKSEVIIYCYLRNYKLSQNIKLMKFKKTLKKKQMKKIK